MSDYKKRKIRCSIILSLYEYLICSISDSLFSAYLFFLDKKKVPLRDLTSAFGFESVEIWTPVRSTVIAFNLKIQKKVRLTHICLEWKILGLNVPLKHSKIEGFNAMASPCSNVHYLNFLRKLNPNLEKVYSTLKKRLNAITFANKGLTQRT